jgi:hypothetical protein
MTPAFVLADVHVDPGKSIDAVLIGHFQDQ